MPALQYRQATESDIPTLAKIRSGNWGTEEFWNSRIEGYFRGQTHPQHALIPRIMYAVEDGGAIIGFIAGHLTTRYHCHGELQWIDVIPEYRRKGAASGLLKLLASWFVERSARKICVDVDPANMIARNFYRSNGAEDLNEHWLVWEDITVITKS
jgi:ribosomal protein S18 acetylase RimI-like enzyme